MAIAATETTSLVAFTLPSTPYSARIARFYIRAALNHHALGGYAEDAGTVTSELVTNAIQYAAKDPTETIGVTIARVWSPVAVAVIVSDSSRKEPVRRKTSAASERGRGLQIVEALSIRWGWHPVRGGKVVFAVIARGD
jgi:anti-sigma regulatory factor (Ser/Thr protein kinase)